MGIEEKSPRGVLLTSVERAWPGPRPFGVAVMFGLACACAMELMMTGGPKHDLARFGMERASNTPRQADLMIVALGQPEDGAGARGRSTTRCL